MPAASLDELRFFLEDRDDIAQRLYATGATTTQVMAVVDQLEQGAVIEPVLLTVSEAHVYQQYEIVDDSDEDYVEIDISDLQAA